MPVQVAGEKGVRFVRSRRYHTMILTSGQQVFATSKSVSDLQRLVAVLFIWQWEHCSRDAIASVGRILRRGKTAFLGALLHRSLVLWLTRDKASFSLATRCFILSSSCYVVLGSTVICGCSLTLIWVSYSNESGHWRRSRSCVSSATRSYLDWWASVKCRQGDALDSWAPRLRCDCTADLRLHAVRTSQSYLALPPAGESEPPHWGSEKGLFGWPALTARNLACRSL
jgi:hypothetical protein